MTRSRMSREKDGIFKIGGCSALERVRDTIAKLDAPPQEVRRALVSALLVEEFGETTLNDPQFQNLVDRVMATLQHDQQANTILESALASLRASK